MGLPATGLRPVRLRAREGLPHQGTGQGPRPPSWPALITGLLISLVMTTITVTTYVSAQEAVVARDLQSSP